MKRLHDPNSAPVRAAANVPDEPWLIGVATSDNWHEPELTSRNGAREVEASTDQRTKPRLSRRSALAQSLGDHFWRVWRTDFGLSVWDEKHAERLRPNETQ